jgi:hypothetical protein
MSGSHRAVGILTVCIGFVLAGQAQQQIASDYAPHTDFSVYKTYFWEKISAPDSTWMDSIEGAIDAQLAAKGWTRMKNSGDAALFAITSSGEAAMFEHFYGGMPGWRWRGWSEPVSYNQGTLVVDIFDTNSQALIWRGFISESVSKKEPKEIDKLDKDVGKLFKDFPPKK